MAIVAHLGPGGGDPELDAWAARRALDGELESVEEVLGSGLEGLLDGVPVRVGSPTFVGGDIWPPQRAQALARAFLGGHPPVLAAPGGRVVALVALGDPLRDEAGAMTADLRRRGWRVGILSGDHPRVVEAVGRELGLEPGLVHGGVSPEGKLAAVEAAGREGPVVMVGDGVNDAAALAAATTGVAVHGGAEASLSAADVYLAEPGLANVVRLLDGSRRVLGVIRRGLAVSLAYNLVAAGLAMGGLINPILAAILMPLSSLTVVSLAYRSRTFER
ncbi:MAG: HAD-IC family P-type ATPase [Planctomycetota bacterium]|nr:HAD-IC family P-type ATPase [Planctomycetota bacterium]